MPPAQSATVQIMDALGYFREDGKRDLAGFRKDWEQLSEDEKEQIRSGVLDGTMTY